MSLNVYNCVIACVCLCVYNVKTQIPLLGQARLQEYTLDWNIYMNVWAEHNIYLLLVYGKAIVCWWAEVMWHTESESGKFAICMYLVSNSKSYPDKIPLTGFASIQFYYTALITITQTFERCMKHV